MPTNIKSYMKQGTGKYVGGSYPIGKPAKKPIIKQWNRKSQVIGKQKSSTSKNITKGVKTY